jgi:thiamine-monophosphate kinase
VNRNLKNYFEKSYYKPEPCYKLSTKLLSFANTSIDVSDGLIADLEKLINKQKLSYKLFFKDIPISNNLSKLLEMKKFKKISFISQGDDYQILFTANSSKSRIISKISKTLGVKISKIGKICNASQKSEIIDQKGKKIALKNKGFYHKF